MATDVTKVKDSRVDVIGLRDFRRELKAMGEALPKELRDLNKEIADKVAGQAEASFRSQGKAPAKYVAGTVKALAQQTGAAVQIGGPGKGQIAFGWEFGGGKYAKGRPSPGRGYTTQFPEWRGNGQGAGYSLFPAVRRAASTIEDTYGDRLIQLAAKAFPD